MLFNKSFFAHSFTTYSSVIRSIFMHMVSLQLTTLRINLGANHPVGSLKLKLLLVITLSARLVLRMGAS